MLIVPLQAIGTYHGYPQLQGVLSHSPLLAPAQVALALACWLVSSTQQQHSRLAVPHTTVLDWNCAAPEAAVALQQQQQHTNTVCWWMHRIDHVCMFVGAGKSPTALDACDQQG